MIFTKLKLISFKLKSMGYKKFLYKAGRKLTKYLQLTLCVIKSRIYDLRNNDSESGLILNRVDVSKLDVDNLTYNNLSVLVNDWLSGSYDILGSGPICIEKNNFNAEDLMQVNQAYSIKIQKLISNDYCFKKWNVDFKSNTTWSLKTPSFKCRYGDELGVDIKVPWELSRLQHLPQLGILAKENNDEKGVVYAQEIINQILDFWAFNPVYMGPNWICAMDVGIRAANILIALEIISDRYSYLISDDVNKEFSKLIYQHGKFIIDNLDYSPELTSNHYVGNIVGLLFVAFFLESSEETDCWLAFSIQEIFSEINKQYCEDGGNFERTSSYHRLSSEMFIWSLALIRGLDDKAISRISNCKYLSFKSFPKLGKPSFINTHEIVIPDSVTRKMKRAVEFSVDITKKSGDVFQFGDNDSGRFFKLTPIGEFVDINTALTKYKNLKPSLLKGKKHYWDECCLDHSSYIYAGAALFNLNEYKKTLSLEDQLINALSRGRYIDTISVNVNEFEFNVVKGAIFDSTPFKYTKQIKITLNYEGDVVEGLIRKDYLETGIVIYKSSSMFLALSNMPNGAKGSGAHSHNDQMHIELQIDGEDISRDPGSYLYTSSPDDRNKFRSVSAHNVMRSIKGESNQFFGSANALFAKENESSVVFTEVTDSATTMQLSFYGVKQERRVIIKDNEIIIQDKSNYEFDNVLNSFQYFSKSFGFFEIVNKQINNVDIEYING